MKRLVERLQNLARATSVQRRSAQLMALAVLLVGVFLDPVRPLFAGIAVVLLAMPGAGGAVLRLLGIPVAVATAATLAWLWIAGSYAPPRDAALLLLVVAATLLVPTSWRQWWSAGCPGRCPLFLGWRGVRAGAIVLVAFWLLSSVADLAGRRLVIARPDSRRFEAGAATPRLSDRAVALALSGGGYRAALVHAGVLFALEHLGVRITGLSAVSGGAIIGSYYVSGGTPIEFLELVQRRRLGLTREVTRFPNLLRLGFARPLHLPLTSVVVLPGTGYARTDAQAELLDALFFHGLRLSDLADEGRPRLMLATSDLVTGGALGFTPNGAYTHAPQTLYARTDLGGAPKDSLTQSEWIPPLSTALWDKPLAHFVAASGAFPGAFAPVAEEVRVRLERHLTRRVLLADGGITDNTGLTLLLVALKTRKPGAWVPAVEQWRPWQADLVLASDGSRALNDLEERETPLSFLAQVGRTVDIVYASGGLRFVPRAGEQAPDVLLLTSAEPVFRSPAWLKDANPKGLQMLEHGPRHPKHSLADELTAAVEAFRRTPTLADVLAPEDARLLFRLGQFMVARRWTGIWFALTGSPEAYAHVRRPPAAPTRPEDWKRLLEILSDPHP